MYVAYVYSGCLYLYLVNMLVILCYCVTQHFMYKLREGMV
jgi:hypothetical protein